MRKTTILKATPAPAQNIQTILDIILQIISVLEALARVFGFNLGGGN